MIFFPCISEVSAERTTEWDWSSSELESLMLFDNFITMLIAAARSGIILS